MVIAVRTERGPDGLEVVKEAETDADRIRLASEAAVLARSAHPGVVEVLDASDAVLRLRHCGSPLARLGPVAPDHAAAIVRAVAEIVDALHRQGIVHRRLDADHVVVSERGRPHLVGFGDAGDGDAPEMADDVAALGALLNRLLDDGADALWSPAHRGVRATTRRKRAMSAFRTAASAAQRPDGGQRPTAHQLATAIGEALPGLTLPTPPGADTAGDEGFAEIPHDIDPTDDLGWSDFDLSFLAVDDSVGDPGPEIERNPAAPRDPYAVLESLASPEPEPDPDPEPEPEPAPEADADAAETEPDEDDSAAVDVATEAGADEADDEDDAEDDATDGLDPIIAKLRSAMATESEIDRPDEPGADEPVTDEPAIEEPAESDPPDAPHTARPSAPLPPASPDRELQPPSIQIRSGSADPTPEERRGLSRRALIAVAVVVLVVGAIAGSVIARAIDPFGSESAAATDTSTDATTPSGSRTPPAVSEGCPAVDLPGPDADADGCPDPIEIDGRTATVGDVEVELGQDGDLVVVADADCDGVATPVLLRPATGEVFDFPGWSLDEPIEVEASTVVDDATAITATDEQCPEVVVTDDAGDRVVVAP